MKYLNTILVLLVAATSVSAQVRQADNWHFGRELSVSFVNGEPVLNPPSAMEAFEGIVSLSDTSGQLLFYTNGGGRPFNPNLPADLQQSTGIIWNRNHEVMYDMRGEEGGGFSARQSSIAMPDPSGEDGIYYLFTMEEAEFNTGGSVPGQPQGRGLSYFIIDMNLNGGLGGVRSADQRVYVPAYEALDATPMADGAGYWIICHSNDPDDAKFIVVPLTAAGVGSPTFYPVSRVRGKIEFSPNGLLMVNDQKLYGFDNGTGAIASDPVELTGISNQAACFTPDSRYLYTTETRPLLGEIIVRYDLRDLADPLVLERLETTGESVLQTAPFQIGPNGNIYFLEQTFVPGSATRYGMSEIVCVSGENPSVNRYLIELPALAEGDFSSQYLPQFVDAIFAVEPRPDTTRLDTLLVDACANEEIVLTARETGMNYQWSNGATTASITTTEAGEYCVTITGDCFPVVDCQVVNFEDAELTVTLIREEDRGCEGLFSVYRVEAGGPIRVLNVLLVRITQNNPPEPLFVESLLDQQEFTIPRFPDVELANLTISAETDNCDNLFFQQPVPEFTDDRFRPAIEVTADGEICNGKSITLEVTNPGSLEIASVRYADGSTDNPRTLLAMFETDIPITVFSECGDSTEVIYSGPVAEFCECRGEIPELISPNNDGTNDEFRLYGNCPAEDYTLIIFNRWGQRVFESSDPDQAWDGTIDGTPQNSDVYLYRMAFRFANSDEVKVREGKFSLIR